MYIPSNHIQESGTWKPLASRGECGERLGEVSIVGGEDTRFGEYPFMALLGNV